MIDVLFEIGGRRVDPSNMGDAIEAMLLKGIANEIHSKISGIRNPDTVKRLSSSCAAAISGIFPSRLADRAN